MSRLIVSNIETQNIKFDSDTTAFSINSSGALGNTTVANNTTYVGDAGSTTQNLVKGILTSWGYVNADASLFAGGTFNMSSGTDNSTGYYTYNFTSNLSNANYSISGAVHDNTDRTVTAYSGLTSKYDVNIWQQNGSVIDSRNRTMAAGDLA